MSGPEARWIDSFLGEAPGVGAAIAPGRSSVSEQVRQPATSAPSAPASFGGSDLIGIGYLTGPEPDEVRGTVAAAFGIAPVATARDGSDLWR